MRAGHAPGGANEVLFASGSEANVPNSLPGVTAWIPPGVHGLQLFLQFVVLDPTTPIGLGHSNGCELLVGL